MYDLLYLAKTRGHPSYEKKKAYEKVIDNQPNFSKACGTYLFHVISWWNSNDKSKRLYSGIQEVHLIGVRMHVIVPTTYIIV